MERERLVLQGDVSWTQYPWLELKTQIYEGKIQLLRMPCFRTHKGFSCFAFKIFLSPGFWDRYFMVFLYRLFGTVASNCVVTDSV